MKHKARYYFPGIIVSETSTRDLSARRPEAAVAAAPDGAFCFVLYDVADDVPDLGPEYRVTTVPQNESGRYYIDATTHTLAEVEAMGSEMEILAANMRCNGWARVVRCRTGNWQPLEDGDEVVGTPVASR